MADSHANSSTSALAMSGSVGSPHSGEQEAFLEVRYDSRRKIWMSVNYPYGTVSNRSVGEAFLDSMRSLDPRQVLEYHYDVRKEKCVKDIYQESVTVAINLRSLGLGRGDVMVLFSGNTYATSSLTFGSLLIGATVNFFEVQLENEDIDVMLDILQPSILVYEDAFRLKVLDSLERKRPDSLKYTYTIDGPVESNIASNLMKTPVPIDFESFQPISINNPQTEIAFLVLTSGSTALPKAIQLSHAAVLNGMYIWWTNPCNHSPLSSNSILFSLSPLRWISQVEILLQSAILGIKRICANKAASGSYGVDILRVTKPTHIFSVPSFFHEVLLELAGEDYDSLKSLKYVQLGGEYPSKVIMDKTKRHAINAKLFHSYGMSEVSGSITNDEHISGGKLQPGYQVQILDEALRPLGPNENGRLSLKTPYPFLGYKGLDNTNHFLQNGFFLNGDYGYFDSDNTLHLLSRCTDLIRANEVVLIPNIVESLAMAEPEVEVARLVGYPNSTSDLDVIACLFVILRASTPQPHCVVAANISQALRLKLSPKEFELIRNIRIVDQLPLTTCGKIDRVALRQWASLL